MVVRLFVLALSAGALPLWAQQPAPADSMPAHRDSLVRRPAQLQEITVTAAPARREEARSA